MSRFSLDKFQMELAAVRDAFRHRSHASNRRAESEQPAEKLHELDEAIQRVESVRQVDSDAHALH